MFCLFVLLNICLPEIGTIIAGVKYGNTVVPDKVGSLICRGIFQMVTCLTIFGWIWAVSDACNYFGDGSFC